jgi:hypothetical protein
LHGVGGLDARREQVCPFAVFVEYSGFSASDAIGSATLEELNLFAIRFEVVRYNGNAQERIARVILLKFRGRFQICVD